MSKKVPSSSSDLSHEEESKKWVYVGVYAEKYDSPKVEDLSVTLNSAVRIEKGARINRFSVIKTIIASSREDTLKALDSIIGDITSAQKKEVDQNKRVIFYFGTHGEETGISMENGDTITYNDLLGRIGELKKHISLLVFDSCKSALGIEEALKNTGFNINLYAHLHVLSGARYLVQYIPKFLMHTLFMEAFFETFETISPQMLSLFESAKHIQKTTNQLLSYILNLKQGPIYFSSKFCQKKDFFPSLPFSVEGQKWKILPDEHYISPCFLLELITLVNKGKSFIDIKGASSTGKTALVYQLFLNAREYFPDIKNVYIINGENWVNQLYVQITGSTPEQGDIKNKQLKKKILQAKLFSQKCLILIDQEKIIKKQEDERSFEYLDYQLFVMSFINTPWAKCKIICLGEDHLPVSKLAHGAEQKGELFYSVLKLLPPSETFINQLAVHIDERVSLAKEYLNSLYSLPPRLLRVIVKSLLYHKQSLELISPDNLGLTEALAEAEKQYSSDRQKTDDEESGEKNDASEQSSQQLLEYQKNIFNIVTKYLGFKLNNIQKEILFYANIVDSISNDLVIKLHPSNQSNFEQEFKYLVDLDYLEARYEEGQYSLAKPLDKVLNLNTPVTFLRTINQKENTLKKHFESLGVLRFLLQNTANSKISVEKAKGLLDGQIQTLNKFRNSNNTEEILRFQERYKLFIQFLYQLKDRLEQDQFPWVYTPVLKKIIEFLKIEGLSYLLPCYQRLFFDIKYSIVKRNVLNYTDLPKARSALLKIFTDENDSEFIEEFVESCTLFSRGYFKDLYESTEGFLQNYYFSEVIQNCDTAYRVLDSLMVHSSLSEEEKKIITRVRTQYLGKQAQVDELMGLFSKALEKYSSAYSLSEQVGLNPGRKNYFLVKMALLYYKEKNPLLASSVMNELEFQRKYLEIEHQTEVLRDGCVSLKVDNEGTTGVGGSYSVIMITPHLKGIEKVHIFGGSITDIATPLGIAAHQNHLSALLRLFVISGRLEEAKILVDVIEHAFPHEKKQSTLLNPQEFPKLKSELGDYFWAIKKYDKALQYYRESNGEFVAHYYNKFHFEKNYLIIRNLLKIGLVSNHLGDFSDAKIAFEKAIDTLNTKLKGKNKNPFLEDGIKTLLVHCYMGIAEAYAQLKNIDVAYYYLSSALYELEAKQDSSDHKKLYQDVLLQITIFEYGLGKWGAALDKIEKFKDFRFDYFEDQSLLIETNTLRALLTLEKGGVELAEESYGIVKRFASSYLKSLDVMVLQETDKQNTLSVLKNMYALARTFTDEQLQLEVFRAHQHFFDQQYQAMLITTENTLYEMNYSFQKLYQEHSSLVDNVILNNLELKIDDISEVDILLQEQIEKAMCYFHLYEAYCFFFPKLDDYFLLKKNLLEKSKRLLEKTEHFLSVKIQVELGFMYLEAPEGLTSLFGSELDLLQNLKTAYQCVVKTFPKNAKKLSEILYIQVIILLKNVDNTTSMLDFLDIYQILKGFHWFYKSAKVSVNNKYTKAIKSWLDTVPIAMAQGIPGLSHFYREVINIYQYEGIEEGDQVTILNQILKISIIDGEDLVVVKDCLSHLETIAITRKSNQIIGQAYLAVGIYCLAKKEKEEAFSMLQKTLNYSKRKSMERGKALFLIAKNKFIDEKEQKKHYKSAYKIFSKIATNEAKIWAEQAKIGLESLDRKK